MPVIVDAGANVGVASIWFSHAFPKSRIYAVEPHDWMLPRAGTRKNFQKAMLERSFEMVISVENLVYVRV